MSLAMTARVLLDHLTRPGGTARGGDDGGSSPTSGGGSRPSAPADEPAVLGRHRVLERLGAGGMGVVYRAHDPELARDVAIKRLHPHAARSDASRARLSREAKALAGVSHPNVVQVYDVGEDGDSIYISMELVLGVDLARWLEQADRPWPEVLAMFLAAGRGLAAAHERGLVHRDFKPSNVLVGDDGRARVVDFGLACLTDDATTAPSVVASHPSASRTGRSGPLTETGTAMGTPAYMAPEQHRGLTADARSDQYAFCLSLYEGLYGARPFEGSMAQELMVAKERDRPRPRSGRGVPRRVLAALLRGLRPAREQRWSSMPALLHALERAAAPRRALAGRAGGAALVATAAAVATYALATAETSLPSACPAVEERLAGVWDAARRDELQRAIEGSGLPYAEATWSRVQGHLDDYAAQWGERYAATCERLEQARSERPEPPGAADEAAALDQRMLCLAARREELASVVDVLGADEHAVRHAVRAVTALSPPSSCDDPRAPSPVDGPGSRVAEEIRRELLRAESLGKVARHAEGLPLAEAALERATAAELPALRAEALLVAGRLHKGNAEPQPAEQRLSEAALLAVSSDRDDLAARAAIELVDVHGAWLTRYDEALEWNRHAQAAIERLGGEPALEAQRLLALGRLETALGHIDVALRALEGSLALAEQVFGEGHPQLAAVRSQLGDVLLRAGRFEESLALGLQALRGGEQAFGPTHPEVGSMHRHLANAWIRSGDYGQAIASAQRAVEILEGEHGSEHPNVGAALVSLGQAQQRSGALALAEDAYRRALPGVAGSPNEAILHGILCDLAREREDHDTALEHARRSRELREALYGPDDAMVAMGLLHEALSLARLGHDHEAFGAFERAHGIAEAKPLPAPIQVVATAYEGRAHLYAGRPKPALELLQRALAQQEQLGAEPVDRADVRFHLVQALWALGREDEARAELAVVDQELATLGERAEHRLRPVRAWVEREHVTP